MAPKPADVVFLRNTGYSLVFATLVAGAITLTLTLKESWSIQIAQQPEIKAPLQISAAAFAGP
jgi:hypothetical protein